MAAKAKRKPTGSSARHQAKGRKPVLLWLDPADYIWLRAMAEADRRPITQFIIHQVLKEKPEKS